MNRLRLTTLAAAVVLTGTATGQWRTETYSLNGGWNAVYLHGDADYDPIDQLFAAGDAANIEEIWRWNPNPDEIQFTESNLIPSSGTPDWSVWKRGDVNATTFTTLTGNAAYLVKCAGAPTANYSVPIKLSPLPPGATWVRSGANLLGFPTRLNGTYPTFADYFETFPAAVAANSRIFRYIGGDLGPANPLQVFSPATERLDRTKAYWFESEVVGGFYGPLEIEVSTEGGIDFGRNRESVIVTVRNRTAETLNVSFDPVASESAPLGEVGITAAVPLTRRVFDTVNLVWTSTILSSTITEPVAPQSTLRLYLGIDRTNLTMASAPPDAFFASFLRVQESSLLTDISLPVTAQKRTLAGLWVGDAELTNVSSVVSNGASASSTVSGGSVTSVTVEGTGGFGYTDPPTVTVAPPLSGSTALAVAVVENGSVVRIDLTSGGTGYAVGSPEVTIAPPPPLANTETPRGFPLRTLLHVGDDGTARLLSQVFLGELAAAPGVPGLCTQESFLKQDAKANAQRLVAAHLPLDQVITAGSGVVAVPGTLVRTVTVPYDDATNPLVHQYHPDHDNLDLRFQPVALANGATAVTATMADGAEAPAIRRTCTFTFTSTPPTGSTVTSGWGSSVIGGTYREVLEGPHKDPIQLDGTFELRRASETGTILTP